MNIQKKTQNNRRLTNMKLKTVNTIMSKTMMSFIVLTIMLLSMTAFSFGATTSDDKLSLVTVSFVSQTPDPVEPGNYVDLRWRISNAGGKAEQYSFELAPEFPFSLDPGKSAIITQQSVGSYESTENGAIVYYRVRVDDKAIEGSDNIIRLFYYPTNNTSARAYLEQTVRVSSQQGFVNIGPVIVSPSPVIAGSEFKISIAVQNLGTNLLSNAKLTLATDNTTFTPIGSTNQQTVSRIAGDSTYVYNFVFFADAESPIRVQSVPITLTYSDNLRRESSVTSRIGIPVSTESDFLVNLERTGVYTTGTKGQVVVSVSNIGKGDLNFVRMELLDTDSYTVTSTPISYLGNLESDDFETGQFDIFVSDKVPSTAKSVPLNVKITFKDSYEKLHEKTVTVPLKMYSTQDAQKLGLVAPKSSLGLIFVVLVIVIVGAIWIIRRRRAAKKAQK